LHLTTCSKGTRTVVSKQALDTTDYVRGWDQDIGYDISLDSGLFLIGGHQ
jgi:hypothetical protein